MKTFKEFNSSQEVAKSHRSQVKSKLSAIKSSIDNRLDTQRNMMHQHLLHRTVNKEIKKLGNGTK